MHLMLSAFGWARDLTAPNRIFGFGGHEMPELAKCRLGGPALSLSL